jgi:hypothetical protein
MDQEHSAAAASRPQPHSDHDLLVAIGNDVHQTHETVRAIVRLLLPKGDRGGPGLEDLLAMIVVQLRETLTIVRQVQADVRGIADRDGPPPEPNGHAGLNEGGRG